MRVVFLRTNRIDPDPRVEKEAESLMKLPEFTLSAVVWDRGERYGSRDRVLHYQNGEMAVHQFGIPASWGGGMKANFFPMLKFEWKLFWWLMLHSSQYDTVHACDLLTGLPAWLPCRLHRKKMVYDIFDYYAATTSGPGMILRIFDRLEKGVINAADAVIICSEKRSEQIAGTHPKKLTVLHNAPSGQQLNANPDFHLQSVEKDVIRVAYAGNLVENRYLKQCIDALNGLENVEFHIGGYGAMEDWIRKQAEENQRVFFYGKLDYDQVITLEKQCDLMIALYDPEVPNHKYAAPNKFYEAMALGKPLIMFHHTGMDENIKKYDVGEVCDPDTESLRRAFEKLIARKDEYRQMAEREKKLFHEMFSWEMMEKRLHKLYKEL